jgi:hypothetical protein
MSIKEARAGAAFTRVAGVVLAKFILFADRHDMDSPRCHASAFEGRQRRSIAAALSCPCTNYLMKANVVTAPAPTISATSEKHDPVVAVCVTHEAAQALVAALQRARFDMTQLSLVGNGSAAPEHVHGFFTVGDRVKAWASTGSLWGAGWGLLLGAAIVAMPPIGVVVAAGPFVAMLLAVLESAAVVGGVSAIAAALTELGMSPEHAANYEADVKADRFLVIVHGSPADIARARTIVEDSRD